MSSQGVVGSPVKLLKGEIRVREIVVQPLSPQSAVAGPCFSYLFVSFLRVVRAYSVRLAPFPCLHFCFVLFLLRFMFLLGLVVAHDLRVREGQFLFLAVVALTHNSDLLTSLLKICYFLFFNIKTYCSFLHLSLISGNHRHKSERNCKVSSENGNELEIF